MNILISSALLAFAIMMVAHSISGPRPVRKEVKEKQTKSVSSKTYYKTFDLSATDLKRSKKRTVR